MDVLLEVLEEAQARGLVGPGPVDEQIGHARTLAELVGPPPGSFLDLGSGGGVPGLVLAQAWPEARGTLLDSHRRAGAHLEAARDPLGLGDRVDVVGGRAEAVAREPDRRASYELVVARSFGPPAVTAECAVGFLQPGGRLVVSEPPGSRGERWDGEGLAQLGLSGPVIRRREGVTVALLTLEGAVDARWPRRPGIPAKRPLWQRLP